MECIVGVGSNILYAALGSLFTFLIGLVHKKYKNWIFHKALFIKKNTVHEDLSNINCFIANPNVTSRFGKANLAYFYEYMAFGEINSQFKKIFKSDKSINCFMSPIEFNREAVNFQNHIILIGGPNHNSLTKNFFFSKDGIYTISFSFNENNDLIYSNKNGSTTTYSPNNKPNNSSEEDYALILNVANCFDNNKRIILICGCNSIGCYGGALFLSNHLKEITNEIKDQEYALVIRCTGNQGVVTNEFVKYYPLKTI